MMKDNLERTRVFMYSIDWVKVSEMIFGGLITLAIAALSIILNYRLMKLGERERDEELFELAVLRTKAVAIRNE